MPAQIQVAYPENYPNKELAGKTVDFSVVVREIKQKVLPEARRRIRQRSWRMRFSRRAESGDPRAARERTQALFKTRSLRNKIVSRLIEACSFAPPPSMVERQTRYLMERYQNQMPRTSGPSRRRSAADGRSAKTLEGRALRQVQATLLVEKISQLENIEITDKDVQERVENLSRAAGDRAKTVREAYSRPDTRDDLRAQMVFDRTLRFFARTSAN